MPPIPVKINGGVKFVFMHGDSMDTPPFSFITMNLFLIIEKRVVDEPGFGKNEGQNYQARKLHNYKDPGGIGRGSAGH